MHREIITKNGYKADEVISALQKSIRRGWETPAVYFAYELYSSGYAEWCWKRLRIISSEDIGLAEPGISTEIWSLYQMHKEAAKNKEDKGEPQRLFLVHAVLLLCRAKKSRLVDWTLIVQAEQHDKMLMDVPDVALDKHTGRGRSMGRGFGHFFDEGTQLHPHEPLDGETEARQDARKLLEKKKYNGLFD